MRALRCVALRCVALRCVALSRCLPALALPGWAGFKPVYSVVQCTVSCLGSGFDVRLSGGWSGVVEECDAMRCDAMRCDAMMRWMDPPVCNVCMYVCNTPMSTGPSSGLDSSHSCTVLDSIQVYVRNRIHIHHDHNSTAQSNPGRQAGRQAGRQGRAYEYTVHTDLDC